MSHAEIQCESPVAPATKSRGFLPGSDLAVIIYMMTEPRKEQKHVKVGDVRWREALIQAPRFLVRASLRVLVRELDARMARKLTHDIVR
jgi:hypothetical protein